MDLSEFEISFSDIPPEQVYVQHLCGKNISAELSLTLETVLQWVMAHECPQEP